MHRNRPAIILGAAALGLAVAASFALTRPRAAASDPHAGLAAAGASLPDTDTMVARLRLRLSQRPDDPDGWRMLGWSEAQLGHPDRAVEAYRRLVALAPAAAGDWAALAQAALASGARDEARRAADRALAIDPRSAQAMFASAMVSEAEGQRARAVTQLDALLAAARVDAATLDDIRAERDRIAAGRPPEPAPAAPAAPAPDAALAPPVSMSAADAIQAMPPGAQQAAIEAMVARLDARLRRQPGDLDGWTRLMRSRMVLGQPEAAARAYRDARAALRRDAAAQAALKRSAASLGIPG